MAVSPRLARKFQQTLGSDAAEDLVSWMDQVDSQGEDVRTMIARIGEWREASRADLAEMRQEMHAGFSQLRQEMVVADTLLRQDMVAADTLLRQDMIQMQQQQRDSQHRIELVIADLRTVISDVRSDLLKWTFAFWIAAIGAIAMLR